MGKIVRLEPINPDVIEIDGIPHVKTLFISNFLRLPNELDYEILQKEYLSGIELSELAVHASFSNPEKMNELLSVIDLSKILFPSFEGKPFLIHALRHCIMSNWHSSTPSEQDVYDWFREKYKEVLGEDFEIAKRKTDAKHKPDFWLFKSSESEYYPVEIKLNAFDEKALSQLRRYMEHYNCHKGVAIGSVLECAIPSDIIFYQHDVWEFRRNK